MTFNPAQWRRLREALKVPSKVRHHPHRYRELFAYLEMHAANDNHRREDARIRNEL
jgi:hypothetical protein